METRSPVASSEITYSPGHNFPRDRTPAFASLRVSASSTKCRLPSSRILKMQKRRRIQTPNGADVLGGQWSNYRIKWCVGYRLRDLPGGSARISGRGFYSGRIVWLLDGRSDPHQI